MKDKLQHKGTASAILQPKKLKGMMFLCLYLQVVLEQLELLWKHPLMEEDKWMIEKKKHKNESEWIGIHSMKSACIVSKSGPWLVGRNVL